MPPDDPIQNFEQAEAATAQARRQLADACAVQVQLAQLRCLAAYDLPAYRVIDPEGAAWEADRLLRFVEAWLDLSRE